MAVETPTIDQVLDLAHQLPRRQRAELISRLAIELADPEQTLATSTAEDPWQRLDRLREEFRALGPASPSMAEQLDADRRSRDASLSGEA